MKVIFLVSFCLLLILVGCCSHDNQKYYSRPEIFNLPKGPGRNWTVTSALDVINGNLKNRDFNSGRSLFFASNCADCHQIGEYGSDYGPDLSEYLSTHTLKDLIEGIIEPCHQV